MRVPLLDLCGQYQKLKTPIDAAVARVLASGRYVMGPELQSFEQELAAYVGTKHAVAVASGTDALLSAAMALEIGLGTSYKGPGHGFDTEGEVVTTAYSFFATPETAVRLGARPVFADLAEDSFNADIDDLLNKCNSKTRAILPVHTFGRRLDVTRLVATGIPVIEDAAQTLVPGIGSTTACATLSFFPTKNLGAVGDAGAVVTSDSALYEKLQTLRQHGSKPKYIHHLWGGNFRMDPIQAAILRVKLPHLDAWQAERRNNAARYRQALAGLPLRLPEDHPEHVYHHFVIRAPRRDALKAFLAAREIETEVYYPLALHLQPCFAQLGYKAGDCPRAEAAANEALALPVHAELTSEQLEFVAESIRAFYK
jgi:dTDP-4-amino-4,6-dideoxygalactose transaminase